MSAEALRGVIPVWAWLGIDQQVAGAERRSVVVRVASYIVCTLIAALAIKTL